MLPVRRDAGKTLLERVLGAEYPCVLVLPGVSRTQRLQRDGRLRAVADPGVTEVQLGALGETIRIPHPDKRHGRVAGTAVRHHVRDVDRRGSGARSARSVASLGVAQSEVMRPGDRPVSINTPRSL